MDIQVTPQSKPQWRYERPHRVRLFTESIHINDAHKMNHKELYWSTANKFSLTPEYQWANDNEIQLDYMVDDSVMAWNKTIIFYADLNESQYVDYALRFFVHREEWK
jgi:hypothetical protein